MQEADWLLKLFTRSWEFLALWLVEKEKFISDLLSIAGYSFFSEVRNFLKLEKVSLSLLNRFGAAIL